MNESEELDRPFECELCGRHFGTREQMKDHVWEYHEMDGDIPP